MFLNLAKVTGLGFIFGGGLAMGGTYLAATVLTYLFGGTLLFSVLGTLMAGFIGYHALPVIFDAE